jgi:hypothetical protein
VVQNLYIKKNQPYGIHAGSSWWDTESSTGLHKDKEKNKQFLVPRSSFKHFCCSCWEKEGMLCDLGVFHEGEVFCWEVSATIKTVVYNDISSIIKFVCGQVTVEINIWSKLLRFQFIYQERNTSRRIYENSTSCFKYGITTRLFQIAVTYSLVFSHHNTKRWEMYSFRVT